MKLGTCHWEHHWRTTYFSEVEPHWCWKITCPLVLALWASVPCLPVPVHDWLQNGSKRSDSNASANEDCMLSPENLWGWCSKRTINVDNQWLGQLGFQAVIFRVFHLDHFNHGCSCTTCLSIEPVQDHVVVRGSVRHHFREVFIIIKFFCNIKIKIIVFKTCSA